MTNITEAQWMEALDRVGRVVQSDEFAAAVRNADRILDEAEDK